MNPKGRHAIVIGASMGGLLAARVLADHYEQVTVLERDHLPPLGHHRKGVPQGQHAHGLLGRGREVLEDFFPGLTRDLVAHGALSADNQQFVRWYAGGQALAQAPSGIAGLGVSRPLLEGYIRQRLAAMPEVRLIENCDVLGLTQQADRVTGVRVVRRNSDKPEEHLQADLVLDASGRGSQSPRWLEALGYARPVEETIRVDIAYATALFRRQPGDADGQTAVVVARTRACPRGAALIALEGDRWMLSLGGFAGDVPPSDLGGFRAFARTLPSPEVRQIAHDGEPLGEIVPFRYPASQRRRYERLARFPEGFLVFGDALCSFNPVYGQGMTSAALQALALHGELGKGTAGLAPRFFRAAAAVVDIPWQMAAGSDLLDPRVEGRRTPRMRLVNAYLGRLFPVAWCDPEVAGAFLRVTNLMAPPASLMAPWIAWRVVRDVLRPSRAVRGAGSGLRTTD